MRSLIRKVLGVRAQGPWILASAILVALIVAPMAGAFGDGKTLRGGARNPSPDQTKAYSKETEIIASVSTYGTRQSNKSSNGGGAVYGCRSGAGGTPKGNEPCLRANNLSSGLRLRVQLDERGGHRRSARSPAPAPTRRRSPRTRPAWPRA